MILGNTLKQVIIAIALLLSTGIAWAQHNPLEGEWGDAPEGALAYPSLGVVGYFPTCYGGPVGRIFHANDTPEAYFGPTMDTEVDGNANVCPMPPYENDECYEPLDGDAGLVAPDAFFIFNNAVQPCGVPNPSSLGAACSVVQWGAGLDIYLENMSGDSTYVNVIFDWNQDGEWGGETYCNGAPIREHAVWNLPVPDGYIGWLSGLNAPDVNIGPNDGYVWVRFTISERPGVNYFWNGGGWFEIGETEDYLLRIDPPLPGGELGDAPEGAMAYPPTGIIGQFPTCVGGGPAGHVIHHGPITGYIGLGVDIETNGNHDLCSFLVYDFDECSPNDFDSGLQTPQSYTIDLSGNVALCSGGPDDLLGMTCEFISWGPDLDLYLANGAGNDMYLNVLMDWDGDGSWGDTATCSNGDTGSEHVVQNLFVPAGFSNMVSALSPPDFQILGGDGFVWARFTLSDAMVSVDWDGAGSFGDGETEDYLFRIGTAVDVPYAATGDLGLVIEPNHPNPFNPRTVIAYTVTNPGPVQVTIHDVSGRRVATLDRSERPAGRHELIWEGRDDNGKLLGSGVYFVRVESAGEVRARKISLLK